jgi:hypothetical protein
MGPVSSGAVMSVRDGRQEDGAGARGIERSPAIQVFACVGIRRLGPGGRRLGPRTLRVGQV